MSEQRLNDLEIAMAHLGRVVEDLSDVAAGQADEIAVLNRRVQMLMERLADEDLASGDGAALSDQKPPHW
jgi:SlyX protein